MTAPAILICYIALAILDLAWGLFLTALNYRSVASHGGRACPKSERELSAEEAAKAAAYSKAKMRLSFVEAPS